jgi:hypothetical protein
MAQRAPKTRAGVGAPAHRTFAWTGFGWWRRKAWLTHEPRWYPIATSGLNGGMTIDACSGHVNCIEVRTRFTPGVRGSVVELGATA